MKKTGTLLITILLALSSFCQEYIEFTPSDNTDVRCNIITSDETLVEFEVVLPGIYSNEVDSFKRVEVNGHSKMKTAGSPEVPVLSFLVAIPECDDVNIAIELLDSVRIENINIYPAPEIVEDSTGDGNKFFREEFYYDETVYSDNNYYPGIFAETVNKGAVREQHCVRVFLYPVWFNPVLNEIMAYSTMKVTVTFENASGPENENVGIFNEMLGNTMVNYVSNGLNASSSCGRGIDYPGSWQWVSTFENEDYISQACDYLIVTHDQFYLNADIENLAIHRADFNGFDVVMVKVGDIYSQIDGEDYSQRIRNLVQNTYNLGTANHTFDDKLAYVNLFGDAFFDDETECIPTYPYYEPMGYDIYYTQLTIPSGANDPDPYPDIMIGRCSADNAEQVQNVVNKIINFNPGTMAGNNNMLTALGNDELYFGLYEEVLEKMDVILQGSYNKRLMAPSQYLYGGYFVPEWPLAGSYNENTIPNQWANGLMFINYMGHGAQMNWNIPDWVNPFSYDDLNITFHSDKLPLMVSTACLTGAFHLTAQLEDCMAERFLCYDENMGCIGFYGSTRPTSPYSFQLCQYYYDALFNNYSYVLGENLMEIKIAEYDDAWFDNQGNWINWCDDYNLIGDPALNIFYENIETMLPDLTIKDYEITFNSELINKGDVLTIKANIRNIMNVDFENSFSVECYCKNLSTSESILLGSNQINGMSGFQHVLTDYTWYTENFETGKYEIYIVIDPEDIVTELNESNNSNFTQKNIYSYSHNHFIYSNIGTNANIVTYNLDYEHEGEEIIFGQALLSSEGELLTPASYESISNTSIANLENNNEYQIIQIQKGSQFTDPYIKSIGVPEWQYQISGINYSPILVDLNNDGFEEVICLILTNEETSKLICLNHDGTLRWEFDNFGDPPPPLYLDAFAGNFEGSYNSVIVLDKNGNFYKIAESSIGNPEIVDSYNLECDKILITPVSSDIDNDGVIEILTCFTDINSQKKILSIKADDLSEITVQLINYLPTKLLISDLNNDGFSEVIIHGNGYEVFIYDNELNLVTEILNEGITIREIVTGDVNNDNKNEIICQTKINNDNYIKAFDIEGNETFRAYLIEEYTSCWLSDIFYEDKIKLICSNKENLYIVNFPDAGNNIGWPGQRGNHRNTGILEQPAFFGQSGETVYWANTISLSGDNLIPHNSTIVIKPGTIIKAHAGSNLIVDGNLIAIGSENHPIIIKADINEAVNNYWQGITISNRSTGRFSYCEVYDAEIGVLAEDYSDVKMDNCFFENNIVGIGAFNSTPEIKKNIIIHNTYGICSYKNASPRLASIGIAEPYKNGIVNNNTGIQITDASIYLNSGYNDIYNYPAQGWFIKNISSSIGKKIVAGSNYWGSTDYNAILTHLSPPSNYVIKPILLTPQSTYSPNNSTEAEMLKTAFEATDNGDYNIAETLFKTIIQQFPTSEESYLSVSGLFDCSYKSNNGWDNLKYYYEQLYNDTTYIIEFQKLVYGYYNLCLRKLENFSEAISNYESVIINNPTYNDSVFAVIDIGNTYEEAGNYKSTIGQLSQLVPVSREKHIEKTIDLLLSLKLDDVNKPLYKNTKSVILSNYPNPFKNTTNLVIFNFRNSNIDINVNDVTGKKVYHQSFGIKDRGIFTIELSLESLPPGIYQSVLEINNRPEDAINLIKL